MCTNNIVANLGPHFLSPGLSSVYGILSLEFCHVLCSRPGRHSLALVISNEVGTFRERVCVYLIPSSAGPPSFTWYLVGASLLKQAVHSRVVHGACEVLRLLQQLCLKVGLLKPSGSAFE